ncbi:hypothetical protein MCOR02_005666 [Pyricularia oryzae]|uniref:Uncharacterized protein n=1 Tax=Pyricularia oryzae TaxID=318829 RepID=A0A4P7NLB6_PYROR|nr:hypothetical protein MCOR02_005666 [Pyricularia oryzae]KAI6495290.1 hypothetical protein MCOR13_007244 [Pyricularia oryzae]KAI6586129.1 hypothetical protein MCOR04_004529 [Pyricularia oryzae]KAI6632603.1 hypothetical protein MCOR14_007139 [Pyricularia oryzae]QBZ62933.1 hypothetical protein PoMZ_11822 [Pyricularia oryzae]
MAPALTIVWRFVLSSLLTSFCSGQEAPSPPTTCYWPNGSVHREGILCAGRENGRSFCAQGQACLSNGLCLDQKTNSRLRRMSCADPALLPQNCPAIDLCRGESPGSPGLLRQCPKDETYWFCLRPDVWDDNCANASMTLKVGRVDDGRNGNLSGILLAGEVKECQTDVPTAQKAPAASSSSSSQDSTIAVGVGLGVLLLAAAAVAFFFWRRWKDMRLELDAFRAGMETTSPPETKQRHPSLKRVPSVAEVAFPDDRSELPQTGPSPGSEIHEADAGQVFEVHGTSKHTPSTIAASPRLPPTLASSPRITLR